MMLAKKNIIPVTLTADTVRMTFDPKIFDKINGGEKPKSDFQFLSMELFRDLNLPSVQNDFELLANLSPNTLEEKELILKQLHTIRTRLELLKHTLADKQITAYKLYEKQSADLVTLQLMDTVDEESINKAQAEIRELVREGKKTNLEIVALTELLNAVNEKIEKTNLSIEQSHRDIFSSRLKQARAAANLTQVQLAGLVQVTQGAITSYEIARREPSLTTLSRLSEKLNVSTDWLLGLKN